MNGSVNGYNGGRPSKKLTDFHTGDVLMWEQSENPAFFFNDGGNFPTEGVSMRHAIGAMGGKVDGGAEYFKKLDVWQNPPSFLPAVKERLAKLGPAVDALPEDNLIEVEKFLPKDDDTPPGTPFDWWRTLGVGFFTGLVVGMFAVWQLQEMRRRRQARAAAGG